MAIKENEKYFYNFFDITVDKCWELRKYMQKLEDNDEWYPSPHMITPYTDYLETEIFLIKSREDMNDFKHVMDLEELEDRLLDFRIDAYEM